jgi:hypothetical protein
VLDGNGIDNSDSRNDDDNDSDNDDQNENTRWASTSIT